MALSAITFNPWVVELGSATINDDQWVGDGSTDLAAGEFVRLNEAGQIVAWTDAAVTAPAINMKTYDASVEGAAYWPILILAEDTVLAGQLNSATAPQTSDIGDDRDLVISAQTYPLPDLWAVDATTSNSNVIITGIWKNDHPYHTGHDFAGAYGIVYFKFLSSVITGVHT